MLSFKFFVIFVPIFVNFAKNMSKLLMVLVLVLMIEEGCRIVRSEFFLLECMLNFSKFRLLSKRHQICFFGPLSLNLLEDTKKYALIFFVNSNRELVVLPRALRLFENYNFLPVFRKFKIDNYTKCTLFYILKNFV